MIRQIIFISFILALISPINGQNIFPILGGQRAGTSVFTFLNIGVSARAVGMGESVVALNQDASSVYYNPAAIAQLKDTEISMTQIMNLSLRSLVLLLSLPLASEFCGR